MASKTHRLEILLKRLGITAYMLEKRALLGNGIVGKSIKKDSDISLESVEKITKAFPQVNKMWLRTGEGMPLLDGGDGSGIDESAVDETQQSGTPAKTTGEQLRQQKIQGRQQKGIIMVPIGAQAGYSRAMHDDYALLVDQLERMTIPDFPYDGDEFRAFQAEGDSMEFVNKFGMVDGIPSGMWVMTQRVPQEDWAKNLQLYRIHVVVFQRQIVIKRILQDNPNEIVLHSDNPLYPQERKSLEDVKEIWYVVRKLDWNMPPPVRIEINV